MADREKGEFLAKRIGALFGKQEVGIFVIFIALCILIGIITPKFVKPQNIINILRQISTVGVMAVGQAMVIIVAGIDLSVGSVLALSACVAAQLAKVMDPWAAMTIALCGGPSWA